MKKLEANISYSFIHIGMWAAYAIALTFATNFLLDRGMSQGAAGVLIAVTAAAACLLQMGLGELVSRMKKLKLYTVIVVISIVLAVGLLAMLSGAVVVGVAGFAVAAVLIQAMPAMGNAIGMDAIAKGAPAIYSIARGLGSLSFSLASLVAGKLITAMGMGAITYATLVAVALQVIGAVWFHFCAEKDLTDCAEKSEQTQKGSTNFFSRYPRFALILVAAVFVCISHYMLYFNLLYIVENIGGGAVEQGTATSISTVVELPIMFAFAFIAKKIRCSSLLKLSALMCAVKAAGLILAQTFMGVYALHATQILGFGLYAIASVTYAGQVVAKEDVARAQSYLAATVNAGSVIATAIGGYLSSVNVKLMTGFSTACAAIALVLILLFAQKTPLAGDKE